MKKLLWISVWFMSIAVIGVFAGPAAGTKPADPPRDREVGLEGTWEGRVKGSSVTMIFKAEGIGMVNNDKFHWKLEGDCLVTTDENGETETYQAKVDGKTLNLSGGDLSERVTFTKAGGGVFSRPAAAKAGSGKGDPRLAGRWESDTGTWFELRADGSAADENGTFRHSEADGVLTLIVGTGVHSTAYRIEGDRLFLKNAQGADVEFRRGISNETRTANRPDGSKVTRNVVINGEKLSDEMVARLQESLHVRILDGAYWYDAMCGAWGAERGPTIGFIPAGLKIGGRLRVNASAGTTWVFVNGRQLPWQDVTALQRITQVLPGRYWMDASGNVGYEGSRAVILNLVQLSANGQQGGGAYHSRSDITGIGSGSDGRTSYVMGKDWSVVVGD